MQPFNPTQLKLVGECNRCGLCCTATWRGKTLHCHNLRVDTTLGLPGASFCKAYLQRYAGMDIFMLDSDGEIQALGACCHESNIETELIAPWIGKGCSLQLAGG